MNFEQIKQWEDWDEEEHEEIQVKQCLIDNPECEACT